MKNVLFVTGNKGKAEEVRKLLAPLSVAVEEAELDEIKSLSHEAALKSKALHAFALFKKPLLVEDTCLFLDAFPNFPGTYSKFMARTIGLEGMLRLLEGKKRGAAFVTLVAFVNEGGMRVFKGECRGEITKKIIPPVPEGLAYDAVFVPTGEKRTFSKMTKEEKARFSHRAKAFESFRKWYVDS
ncbi:MAG: non-canonical purine NTP pyrophosphatase [Candidatus Micrarchaeota archaeon]